jgi:hypothetical protein
MCIEMHIASSMRNEGEEELRASIVIVPGSRKRRAKIAFSERGSKRRKARWAT